VLTLYKGAELPNGMIRFESNGFDLYDLHKQ